MVDQIKGEFEVKEPLLQQYYHAARNSIARFHKAPVEHIPREENKRFDALSWLSVTKKKSHQRSVMQVWLRHPSVSETECLAVAETKADSWMTPIIQYLKHSTCKPEEQKTMKQQCDWYTLLNEDLYQGGYSVPLLKCITREQIEYVLSKIHEGVCGNHSGARTMAVKIPRAGYYWATVQRDCVEYVKKCAKCQEFGPLHHAKPETLHSLTSPWSFAIWGMDIIDPFAPEKG